MAATTKGTRKPDRDENTKFRKERLADVKAGADELGQLLAAALAIDAVDDVARGFNEPADWRRVEAACKVLTEGLQVRMPDVERCLSMAVGQMKAEPEEAIISLTFAIGNLRGLATTARRIMGKLGQMPSPERVAAGRRAYRNRWNAEREAREAREAAERSAA